jgi:hypothetical protein
MNRLAPLIVRRDARFQSPVVFAAQLGRQVEPGDSLEDVKLFVMTWLGGLVFFGTFFS